MYETVTAIAACEAVPGCPSWPSFRTRPESSTSVVNTQVSRAVSEPYRTDAEHHGLGVACGTDPVGQRRSDIRELGRSASPASALIDTRSWTDETRAMTPGASNSKAKVWLVFYSERGARRDLQGATGRNSHRTFLSRVVPGRTTGRRPGLLCNWRAHYGHKWLRAPQSPEWPHDQHAVCSPDQDVARSIAVDPAPAATAATAACYAVAGTP